LRSRGEDASPPPAPSEPEKATAADSLTASLATAAKDEADRLRGEGKYKEAVAAYDRAVILTPDPEAYFGRGMAYSALGSYQRSKFLRGADSAFEFWPGKYLRAVEDFDKAIQLKPDFAEAYQLRGDVKDKRNDKAGAQADWEKAKALGYKP
jgi:tetratricopeptide (TPR) repeat protein